MKYLNFKSRAEFYRTNLPETFFTAALLKINLDGGDWKDIKPLILHKDCPDYVITPFTKSENWYIRLTAMLNKNSWKKYALIALQDPKSIIRAAAIKRMFFNLSESPLSENELYNAIMTDKWIHGFFNMHSIKNAMSGNIDE